MGLSTTAILDRAPFIAALVSRATRLNSSQVIDQLIEQAENKLLAGGGELNFLVSAGGNSKTAMQECRMDASEMLGCAQRARDLYAAAVAAGHGTALDGPAVGTTYADFSGLSGTGWDLHRLF